MSKTLKIMGVIWLFMLAIWVWLAYGYYIESTKPPKIVFNGVEHEACLPTDKNSRAVTTIEEDGWLRCVIHDNVKQPHVARNVPTVYYIEGRQ